MDSNGRLPARTMTRFAAVTLVGVLLAGCSLINPHVDPKPLTRAEYDSGTNACRQAAAAPALTLADANQCADAWIASYRGALGDQATLINGLGLAMIPLSAAALGLGVVGGQTTAITALAATGAAGIGAGYWLSSKPREKVYAAGMGALVCAKKIMTPLAFDRAGTDALRNAIYGDPGVPNTMAARSIDQLLAIADGAPSALEIAAAEDARNKGIKLLGITYRAGYQLLDSVGAITAEVDRLIIQTDPDWSSLTDIIKAMPASYGLISGLRPAATAGAGGASRTTSLVPEVRDFSSEAERARQELLRRTSSINGYLGLFSAEVLGRDYAVQLEKQCGVQVSLTLSLQGGDGLVDDTHKIKITKGKAGQASYTIVGGKPYYAVELAKAVAGIKVTVEPTAPQVLVVKWDDKVTEVTSVIVRDASGQIGSFPMQLEP